MKIILAVAVVMNLGGGVYGLLAEGFLSWITVSNFVVAALLWMVFYRTIGNSK